MKVLAIEESAWARRTNTLKQPLLELCHALRTEIQVVRLMPAAEDDIALDVLDAAMHGGIRHAARVHGGRAYPILACAPRPWTHGRDSLVTALEGARAWRASGLAVIGQNAKSKWTDDLGFVACEPTLNERTLRLAVASLDASELLDDHLRDYGGLNIGLTVGRHKR